MTRVSVILPVFNAASYLADCLRSLELQSFRNFEVLVFNDCSTDNSCEILDAYASRDGRFLVTHGEHRGYTYWLNEGISQARGEYIARMDADDVSELDRFKVQVEFLDTHRDVACVGASALMIDGANRPIGTIRHPTDHASIDRSHLTKQGSAIIHPSTMIRTSSLRALGGYRTNLEPAEDLDLWLRLAEIGGLANLDRVLLRYRLHMKNVSLTRVSQQADCSNLAVREAWVRRGLPGQSPPRRTAVAQHDITQLQWSWVRYAIREGFDSTARYYAFQMLRRDPMSLRRWFLMAGAAAGPLTRWARRSLGLRMGTLPRTEGTASPAT